MGFLGILNKFGDFVFNSLLYGLPHVLYNRRKYRKNIPMGEGISIITPTCIGGELYSLMGGPFLSPFINCQIERHEYINIVCHLRDYIESPFTTEKIDGFCKIVLHPMHLPAVTVNFPHDTNCRICQNNWERRRLRINFNKLVFILDDRGTSKEDLYRFSKVECYKKIYLTSHNDNYDFCKIIEKYRGEKEIGQYYSKNYIKGLWRFEYLWDYLSFFEN